MGPVSAQKLWILAATGPAAGHLMLQVGEQRLRIDLTTAETTAPHPIRVPLEQPSIGRLTLTAKPDRHGHITIDGLLLN
jgi:hypothetical protein